MEHSNGDKRKISFGDMAGVVGENRILSGFWKCSTDLIVLLDVDDDNLAVLAMPLNGGAWWQSLSNILASRIPERSELRSLAHVTPDENIEDDEFYFEHASEHPTMEGFRAAQNPSGYPLRLPIGLKKLKNHHNPELIIQQSVRSLCAFFGSMS